MLSSAENTKKESHFSHFNDLLIMFVDDTNLFYSGKDILPLFNTVNNELLNISH